jgi:hypothetical protein
MMMIGIGMPIIQASAPFIRDSFDQTDRSLNVFASFAFPPPACLRRPGCGTLRNRGHLAASPAPRLIVVRTLREGRKMIGTTACPSINLIKAGYKIQPDQ